MPLTWIFDLDDTLHDASWQVFPHLNQTMAHYIVEHLQMDEATAHALQRDYWLRYGATLTGLMRNHDVDPRHFLHTTHALPLLWGLLRQDHLLRNVVQHLPGRKIVFSNGPQHYVEGVTRHLKLDRHFSALYGVDSVNLIPKPYRKAFRQVLRRERLDPRYCIMVEDSLANLRSAKALGMRTVWISKTPRKPGYVDVRVPSVRDLVRGCRSL